MRKSTAFERLETRNVRAEVGRNGNRINFVATFCGAKHVYDNQTLMLEKSTYYILDAQGNQLSMYEHIVDDADVKYYLTERNIYGSSRLGTLKDPVNMFNAEPLQSYGILGNRNYELSNHLGNVLTVISDIKYPLSDDNTTISGYEVGISNIFDYSPFGAPLDGRTIENIFHQEEFTDSSTVLKTIYVLEETFDVASDWQDVASYSQISYPSGKMEVKNPSSFMRLIGAKKGFTTGTGQHAVSFEISSLPAGMNLCRSPIGVIMGAQYNKTSDTLVGTGSYQIQSVSPHYVVVEIRNENNALVLKDSTNSTGTYSYAFSAPQGKEYTISFHNKSMCANLGYQIDNVFISYDTLEVVTGNTIIVSDTLFIINNDFENPVIEPNGAGVKIDGWTHYSPSTTLSVEPHNGSDWLKVVSTNGTHGAHQGFSVEPGESYTFEIDLHRPSGMNKEINVVIWKNTGPSGAYTLHVLNTDGSNTFNYTATSSNIYIQIRQAGTYYLDNIRMYRTYEDTMFVSGYEVDRAYRYGFNSMERDNEIKGKGNSYDFGARMYDPRVGRFFALDPRMKEFPFMSPYVFAGNNPIRFVDVNGEGPGDRVKKAKSFVETPYKQQYEWANGKRTGLRTGTDEEALRYLDCSELVARVIAADGLTSGIKSMSTSELVTFFNDKSKWHKSDQPQVGDVFLWRTESGGHTGIVTDIDENGKIEITHAANSKRGTVTDEGLSSSYFTSQAGWQGFYRPVNEVNPAYLEFLRIKETIAENEDMINFINNTITDDRLKQDLIKPWQDFNNELQSELQNYTDSSGDFDESRANQTYSKNGN